ncbi:MAG: hypothetical protein ABH831_03155 [Candidatus Nealsonbacteria bacterium]
MDITDRQKNILNSLVGEYIESARPVSSKSLDKKCGLSLSSATIRNEMQKLTDAGFISQPHTSAGRVPTDKGYRFFVDSFMEKEDPFDASELMDREITDSIKFIQQLTKNLASESSALSLGYLPEENLFWKEGWETVLQEPEFREEGVISSFVDLVKNFEEAVGELEGDYDIKVFIGRENPFPKAKEFSIIVSRCNLPKEKGILAILGPKRMSYSKTINTLNHLSKLIKGL